MRTMYIMIGLPGSGKSTEVQKISRTHGIIRESVTICSADDYFSRTGSYLFDPSQLGEAHASCMREATEACVRGDDCVIIDNTNLTNIERAPYYMLGVAFNYTIKLVWVEPGLTIDEIAARNVHGVPVTTVRRMSERMENPLHYWTYTNVFIT